MTGPNDMRTKTRRAGALLGALGFVVAIGATGEARAQTPTWPGDNQWLPAQRNGVSIGDVTNDSSMARDVVGNTMYPAVFISSDADFLYFRIRVDGNPLSSGGFPNFDSHGWFCELDTNNNLNFYELITGIHGVDDLVELAKNTMQTSGTPDDLAETLLASYAAMTHARVSMVVYPDPSTFNGFNGNADYFIDWAIPRGPSSALAMEGVTSSTPIRLVCGSSADKRRINSDNTGTGTTLSDLGSDPVVCGNTGCSFCNTDAACGSTCAACMAPTPKCNPATLMCVQCLANSNCSDPTKPICVNNVCSACTMDSQCAAPTPACDTGTGKCVACTTNAHCSSTPSTPYCNTTTNTCVQCLMSDQCSITAPVCAGNVCGPCTMDSQCAGYPGQAACNTAAGPTMGACVQCTATNTTQCMAPTPHCNTNTNLCVGCTMSSQCSAPTPVCKTATGTCVACVANSDCPASAPVCNTSTNTCGPCTSDTDCNGRPTTPACNTAAGPTMGACVQCTGGNTAACVPPNPICNTATNMCTGCTTNADCTNPGLPYCKTATNTCVACLTNANCPVNQPVCSSSTNTCGSCSVDADCNGRLTTPACNATSGACVVCTATSMALCVAPTPACNPATNMCVECTMDGHCTDPAKPVCKTATNTCVQCTMNSQCPAGTMGICNTVTNMCGGCMNDAQCSSPTPACQPSGACGQCSATNTGQCTGTTPVCNPMTGTCVQCVMDSQCSGGTPVCNTNTGTCVQCTSGTQCTGTTPVCNMTNGMCQGCMNDAQCPAGSPACLPNGACGQCSATNTTACMGATPVCNTTTNMCVGCLTSAQCSGTKPVCDTNTNTCVACQNDGAPDCPDPARPACQKSGPLAGACTECSATNATRCGGIKPICLASGTCGCTDTDGDSECGAPMSGIVCSGPAGTCIPGCAIAPGRNTCPFGFTCTNQTGGIGTCFAVCSVDADCKVDPLRYCDYTQSPRRCVQCTQDAHCPMPLVCANTTSRTCVECTPAKLANCSPDRTGAACLPSNTCGCTMDSHCGGTMSGRVCETVGQRCQVGCRAVGGNGCPAGQICTSTTNAIGLCVPAPIVVVTDAGAVSDAAPRDAAAGRDAGGPGDVPQALPDAAPDLRIADAAARDIATDAVAGARPDAIEAGGVDAVREAGVAEAGAPRDGAAEAGTAPADVPRAVALDTGMATSAVDSGQEPLLPPPVTDDGSFIAGGGCGCRVGDAGGGIGAPAFGLLALGGVLLLRRRSRRRP